MCGWQDLTVSRANELPNFESDCERIIRPLKIIGNRKKVFGTIFTSCMSD